MRGREGTEEGLSGAAAATLGETHVLAACGAAAGMTRWGLHQVLTGRAGIERPVADPLSDFLRESLEAYFARRSGCLLAPFPGDAAFTGRFAARRPTVIVEPGSSPAQPGDVLVIETPARRAYDAAWGVDFDSAIPDAVKARANMRMAVAGAPGAVVWVFADNGAVDESRRIARDDAAIAAMRAACFEAEADAMAGNEPSPDDEDLLDYVVGRDPGETGEVVDFAEDSPEASALREIVALQRESEAIHGRERSLRGEQRTPKNRLLRALAGKRAIRIGGRLVGKTVVVVEPREKGGYRFVRLDIEGLDNA